MTWDEACREIAEEICKTLISKQHDYGHANINEFGELGILIRSNDKMARLKNLYKKEAPKNESVDDTWMDLAGYSIIAIMKRRGTFDLELNEVSDNIC